MLDRRNFLKLTLAAQAFAAFPANAASPNLRFGEPQPFSLDWLKAHAQALAAAPYSPPPRPDPGIVASIDYDAHGKLKYRNDFALYGDGHPSAFPITFMHVGQYFPKTVRMYAVEPTSDGGSAREILYDRDYFSIPADSVAAKLPTNPSPFAGFWLREPKAGTEDWRMAEPWLTFLGASYFRAKGELGQVGLSARGIALTPGGNAHRGVSGLRGLLVSACARGCKDCHGICSARRAKRHRRLQIRHGADEGRGHGHRDDAVLPSARRAAWPRAAHLDVLVFRNGEAGGHRLASGGA